MAEQERVIAKLEAQVERVEIKPSQVANVKGTLEFSESWIPLEKSTSIAEPETSESKQDNEVENAK